MESEKMEECGTEDKVQDEIQVEEPGNEQEAEDESERGRPSTPKWWRPPVPPETYKWEEVRRQRQKGGYPWTHLDKDEEIDADDYLDDNLYEPVNPPPLYGNDSYLSKDLQQVPQAEERMIEIPPEIEILTSEGLDGLDKPDPHDLGFDGDREWQNASEDEGHQSRSSFTAGIRSKSGESRSTTPKSVGFSPDTITHETPADDYVEDQEVPGETQADPEAGSSSGARGRRSRSSSPGRKQTAFDILKSKAADAADHVKQRIRSAIPVRPKFTKSRKRRKVKHEQEEGGEQEVPEDAEMKEGDVGKEEQVEKTEEPPEEAADENTETAAASAKDPDLPEEEPEDPEATDEEKSAKQQQKEEKERKKAEEKLAKQKAVEEAKQAKLEEKLAKAREAEEKRQAKAEEEKRKQQEKEEAAKKAAEAKKEEEARKAAEKAAKEEEARKAAEAKKAEEEARKAAEKAKKEEEAKKRAEAKKAEEERKAAEKAKKEEEARKAAEAKKAEEERKAAEKAAKEEEARKAAEAKKAEEDARKAVEEEARKEAEAKRAAEEEANKEEKAVENADEETQPMDTTEAEAAEGPVQDEEEAEAPQPVTPSGTTKRKYIRHRKGVPTQLSQLPNPIASLRNQVEDFKNKLKRSRTPPRRQVQRKHRRSRSADASKSPPRDLDDISNKGDEEEEKEQDAASAIADNEGDTQQTKETDEQPKESPVTEEAKAVVKSEAKPDADVEKSSENLQQSSSTVADETAQAPEEAGPTTSTGTTERKKRKQPAAKEKLDKIGAQLKGFGAKSIGIASQASSGIGNTLKVVGKDLQKLGAKAVGELKSKQDSSKNKAETPEVIETVEEPAPQPQEQATPEPVAPPKRTFRFKRRNESQDEGDEELGNEDQEHFYENAQEAEQETHTRNALLGSGARDWESPHDRQHSPGISEERFSGNVSSRDSPPGSSLASSTIAQVRRTGVLEEIDSDEFFLRERGISEGEDEEEVNRFLVEELRQAFRPSLSNALTGFDMEPPLAPPSRPERAPRKPPRKDKESTSPSMYQTFPPERPKRKQPQGYVSKFMKENPEEEGDYSGSNEEVRGSTGDMDEELDETDAMQLVKDKLTELDRELEDADTTAVHETQENAEQQEEPNIVEEYEDDGRYEPINDGPTKPTRTKRKQPMRPPTPPTFYYNTIAGNEWLRELEEQVQGAEPALPVRKRRGSGKSSSAPPESDEERREFRGENIPTYSEPTQSAAASVPESGNEDNADYVDEAGYAIVQKDRDLPKTIPRKKKKRTNQSGQSGGEQTVDPSGAFFSLPRGPSRSSDETPPARPHRTYSTLRPRRPPRSKSGSRNNLESRSPIPSRREGDEPRPSTAIGIMQGRPLPPPPRPQRSPAPPLGEIEQTSIEEAVGLRHYANFEDIEAAPLEEVLTSPPTRVIEVDIACQTDPVPDDEFIIGLPEESQMEDSGRIRTASSRLESQETQQEETQRAPSTTTAGDVSSSFQTSPQPSQPPPPPPKNIHTTADSLPTNPTLPTFSFPTKLHLEQLEVDFLRVNDLVAQSIKVEHLQASQLEVNSISATGPVCVSRIQTQSLNSDEVNCSRLSSDTVDMPSIPPSSFFQFFSSDQAKPGSEQELCLKAEEKEDKENESACPPDLFDSVNNLMENENVDSSNDLKSSHVAEKIVDKQLNLLPDSAQTEDNSKPERKDASVGTSIPSTRQPQQLNNLNQTSSSTAAKITSESPEIPETVSEVPITERQIFDTNTQFQQSSSPTTTAAAQVETAEIEEDEPEEENVVCGSYTLPYSYMPPQSQSPTPSAPARSSSLKKSQRPADSVPKTPPSPRRSDAHIAFGHTSVAQGDVLSVKLSIPVERGSIGHPQTTSGMRSPPHSQGRSSPNQLPESTNSEADSAKKDAQKQVVKERNGISVSSTTPTLTPAPPSTTPAQSISSAPISPPETQQGDATDSEESFLATSARLGRAVLRFTMRALQAMADYIDTAASEDPTKTEQQRANMQVLLCLLLFLLVGLILATTRSGPYSSPRWEFLMPPPDL